MPDTTTPASFDVLQPPAEPFALVVNVSAPEGNALGSLGIAYADLGEVERAIGYYEQHLAITREIGDRRGEGNALGNLGLADADLGEVERAIGLLEQALRIGQEIKDPRIMGFTSAQLERLRGGGAGETPENG
jgi:tetratricopeptide (TPR) repeat protein